MNETHLAARIWFQIKTAGRLERFNAWRKDPTTVTRGYLAFRDIIVILFCGAIVTAGVTTVSGLRADDCRAANDRRAELREVTIDLINNDRLLLSLADQVIEGGLPVEFTALSATHDSLELKVNSAYAEAPCPPWRPW